MPTPSNLQSTSSSDNMYQCLQVLAFISILLNEFRTVFCFHGGQQNQTYDVEKLSKLKDAIENLLSTYNRTSNYSLTPLLKTNSSEQSGNGTTTMSGIKNELSNMSEHGAEKCPIGADPRKS